MADWMRETVESTLGPAKATVKPRTETRTPTGGTTYIFGTGQWGYCNIAPMTSEELELSGRMGKGGTVACRVSAALDVDVQDRVLVEDTDMDELDGLWDVTAVLTGFPVVDRLLFLARIV